MTPTSRGRRRRLELHRQWWEQRIARQREIDASIAARAEYEYLYDKPYEDRSRVRVAGPFTPWRASRPTGCWAWTRTAT